MTDLPPGWAWATMDDLITANGIFTDGDWIESKDQDPAGEVRLIQLADIGAGNFRDRSRRSLTLRKAHELRCTFLQQGDILVARMPEPLGRACILPKLTRPSVTAVDVCIIRPGTGSVNHIWLMWAINSPQVHAEMESYQTGTTRKRISRRNLAKIHLPVPPCREQRRIVEVLEDHLSRLDVATADLNTNRRRLTQLTKRVLVDAVPIPGPKHWEVTTVGAAGAMDLGRQRHPHWHSGPHMRPYLRVANVFEDRIDLSDVMEMDFPPDIFERYRLTLGDILLNEGQSPELLGRPAMYRGDPPEIAFTNSLLRFRAGGGVDPEWALLVFRRHMHAGRFMREVRITTNIAHLSAGRFKSVEFPIPPLDEQRRIVARTRDHLGMINGVTDGLTRAQRRASHLRESLLREAFAGRLVAQDPSDEPASVLLERIAAERGAGRPSAVRRRTPRARRTSESVSGEAKDTLW